MLYTSEWTKTDNSGQEPRIKKGLLFILITTFKKVFSGRSRRLLVLNQSKTKRTRFNIKRSSVFSAMVFLLCVLALFFSSPALSDGPSSARLLYGANDSTVVPPPPPVSGGSSFNATSPATFSVLFALAAKDTAHFASRGNWDDAVLTPAAISVSDDFNDSFGPPGRLISS